MHSIPNKNRRFFAFGLLACLSSSLCVVLSVWQWHRYEEKEALLKAYTHMEKALPKTLTHAQGKPYEKVITTGRLDVSHSFLLDNQFYQHSFGYNVITPLYTAKNKVLLVDRGWISGALDRAILPTLKTIQGVRTLTGTLNFPSEKYWVLGSMRDPNPAWPMRIERLDPKKMGVWLGKPVYPFILRLDPHAMHGFTRAWPLLSFPPSRHLGYALQWGGLALVIMIGFLSALRKI